MKLSIDPEWLRRMADAEANRIVSVGGLVARIEQCEEFRMREESAPLCEECGKEARKDLVVLGRFDRSLSKGPLCEECYLELRHGGDWVDDDFPDGKIWLDDEDVAYECEYCRRAATRVRHDEAGTWFYCDIHAPADAMVLNLHAIQSADDDGASE